MRFTPPLRANSELGDTLEPFLRQPHLTSSHTLTSKSHHPLQCFPFHVIQSLLLLLDFAIVVEVIYWLLIIITIIMRVLTGPKHFHDQALGRALVTGDKVLPHE